MSWIADAWNAIPNWVPALLALIDVPIAAGFVVWVLWSKRDATAAIAWCLAIVLLPFFGPLLFFVFGYQHVSRPLQRKRAHRQRYQNPAPPKAPSEVAFPNLPSERHAIPPEVSLQERLASLAQRFGASAATVGNRIEFFDDGNPAFEAMIAAIGEAKHHIHLEFFIWEQDRLGLRMLDLLTRKASQGVEVRLLYDAMGSWRLSAASLRPLHEAGGKSSAFLSLSLLRRRLQVNMRNHRKILVVDGRIAFVGGLNVGDEYLGLSPTFGFWRDAHVRIQGPAAADLQRVFCEDWDFAAEERLLDHEGEEEDRYFPAQNADGPYAVQVIESGPDQDPRWYREVVFAGLMKARRRIWIATPYFVPDQGLFDALKVAAYSRLDVRLMLPENPDKVAAWYAGRYLFDELLTAGARIYLYAKGMMHSKILLLDDEIASVGSSNFDNRSFHLNFEVSCMIYSQDAVRRLEASLERDFADSAELNLSTFRKRSIWGRLAENACRLMSPVL